ncbi:unnamed protein product [Ranitomeya imitator]|uniref:Protein BUD31 homolog n=2 Tax=Hyloidea TaxID=8417 RepID=A0ABN9LYW1_9NEOB|nr:unnamed protein product [Ranitomeya imitator]
MKFIAPASYIAKCDSSLRRWSDIVTMLERHGSYRPSSAVTLRSVGAVTWFVCALCLNISAEDAEDGAAPERSQAYTRVIKFSQFFVAKLGGVAYTRVYTRHALRSVTAVYDAGAIMERRWSVTDRAVVATKVPLRRYPKVVITMPKVKRSRKPPPDGWELIEPTLDELDQKMREAETDPHEGKRKVESLWPIFRIHHQKTRYIFDLFYKRKAISRELYDYCIREGYADKNLIAKWKKQGYENLCCLRCIQTRDTNFGTNCICRVPKGKLEVGRIIECTHCGCRGCSG